MARISAVLGANDAAIAWLDSAVRDRSWVDQYLRVNPAYDALRGDADFERILAEVGA